MDVFKHDHVYSAFLGDNFNLQQTIASINNLAFNEQVAKISSGIEHVKQCISLLTSQNCEEFFQRTSKLDDLYQELQFIQIKSQNLYKTLELIKAKLETPYHQLLKQINLISRLQQTCDLLRKMIRIMHLSKRIYECNLEAFRHENEQTIYFKEIVKVSQYLNEVDMIINSDEDKLLFKLNLINKDLQQIKLIKTQLEDDMEKLLIDGIQSSETNTIGTALQVLHNLGLLENTLNTFINDKCIAIEQAAIVNLSIRELKGSKLSNAQANSLRLSLRNGIKAMLDSVTLHFNQTCNIVRILRKKRDHLNQTLLIEFVTDNELILNNFWNRMIHTLTVVIGNQPTAFKQLMEMDYPKVLPLFLDFWKIFSHTEPDIGNEKSLRGVILNFESAYLSNSLSSLFSAVNRIFNDARASNKGSTNFKVVSVPSERDVDSLIESINNELSYVKVDSQLLNATCKNVLKTINLFVVKCEHLAAVDGDSTQVIGPFTSSQRHNALIVHILNIFGQQIEKTLSIYSKTNTMNSDLDKAQASIDSLILTIFEPLINSIQDAIEAIISTMYNEDYNINSTTKNEEVQCSLYMKELTRFIARVSQDYLSQFGKCVVIEKRIWQMAATTIDMFLLHKCLITPVSDLGRKKIAADFNQLELAILPISERMGDMGRSYKVLRAFKTLLFLTPEEVAKSETLGNPIPYHLILFYLISNFAPEDFRSPQKILDYSLIRYIKWIETSTNEQRFTLINDTLDSYVKQVRKSQKKTFAPIYPVLVEIMKRALNNKSIKP
ncbi:hypothetical protein RDWZM_000648 [Blomia tropicalis]|uniref:Conserved oligomeric Golgi complex subunit 5 n=1 Tax=Blomia tropicalis TaxID=40697 RepID=A0A9Q0MBB8_BLOTA|nr:hypothetical protein RDWZM_000648 [Blomia tropicalis]